MATHAGIKTNVGDRVDKLVTESKQSHQNVRQEITHQGDEVKKQHADLENTHKTEGNNFRERYNKETDSQVNNPFSSTTERFRKKAEEAAKEMDDK